MIAPYYLRRGMVAGLPAGLFAETFMDEAIRLVFWVGLGVVFGLLCERANRREPLGS